MADMDVTPVQQQSWADPKADPGSDVPWMVHTPIWHVVLRGFQVFFGFVIVIMAGVLIHGKSLDANAFALVCGLFTWIVVTYALLSEKNSSFHSWYNIWAILSLDFLMALFWLASMGANAALRTTFNVNVNVHGCSNDGSAVNSNTCVVSPSKRDNGPAVASPAGLAMMSAIAGLSALNWLLFLATLIFNGHTFRLYYQANKTTQPTDNATVEMKAQEAPMLNPGPGQQPMGAQPQSAYPQYTDQQQYQAQVVTPQTTGGAAPVPSQSPGPQYPGYQTAPGPYGQPQQQPYHEVPGQQQQQYQAAPYQAAPYQAAQYSQTYSPSGTPAQGQPYYPPAQ